MRSSSTSESTRKEAARTSSAIITDIDNNKRTSRQLQAWKASLTTLVRECSESSNPYLNRFASSPLAVKIISDDRIIGCFGRKNRSILKKELLEAAALEARLERIYGNTRNSATIDQENDDEEGAGGGGGDNDDNSSSVSSQQHRQLVIWDLCSGKGYSSAWLSVNTYPDAKIHLVDTDTKTNRDYLEAFPNLIYHHLDLYSKELEEQIRQSCTSTTSKRSSGGKKKEVVVLLVGIHLCGDLSRRALELRLITGAEAAVISPCCAMRSKIKPKKRVPGSFGYDVPQIARQLKVVTPYDLWCWMLWGYAYCSSTPSVTSSVPSDANSDTESSSSSPNNNDTNDHNNNKNRTDASTRGRRHNRRLDLTFDPLMRTDKNKWLVVVDEKG